VSSEGIYPAPYSSRFDGSAPQIQAFPLRARKTRYWLHALLFLLTLLSTTFVGARFAVEFEMNRPIFAGISDFDLFREIWTNPAVLLVGLPFSVTLLLILLAHEMGHYLACVYYRIDATLPYFLPSPTLIGTLGAFIRIRSPIYSKRVLFDVGIAGPLAGFVFLLPALGIGLAFSKVVPGIEGQSDIVFGTPPLLWLLQQAVFPGVPSSDIYLHPVARAAWVGLLATALNLLPIGQLDGGHILYSFVGDRHKMLSRVFIVILIPLGIFFWYGWLFWAALLFLFGMKHPAIYDVAGAGAERRRLALLAVSIFLLSFSLAPIQPRFGF
jgi:membrane-associated protease RseP (regulator of RpoE activity)